MADLFLLEYRRTAEGGTVTVAESREDRARAAYQEVSDQVVRTEGAYAALLHNGRIVACAGDPQPLTARFGARLREVTP